MAWQWQILLNWFPFTCLRQNGGGRNVAMESAGHLTFGNSAFGAHPRIGEFRGQVFECCFVHPWPALKRICTRQMIDRMDVQSSILISYIYFCMILWHPCAGLRFCGILQRGCCSNSFAQTSPCPKIFIFSGAAAWSLRLASVASAWIATWTSMVHLTSWRLLASCSGLRLV